MFAFASGFTYGPADNEDSYHDKWKSELAAKKNAVNPKTLDRSYKCRKCGNKGYIGKFFKKSFRRLNGTSHYFVQCDLCKAKYNDIIAKKQAERVVKPQYNNIHAAFLPFCPAEKEVFMYYEFDCDLTVSQVLDEHRLLVYRNGRSVIMTLAEPHNYADGDLITNHGKYQYVGNESYISVTGARRTVRSLKQLKEK